MLDVLEFMLPLNVSHLCEWCYTAIEPSDGTLHVGYSEPATPHDVDAWPYLCPPITFDFNPHESIERKLSARKLKTERNGDECPSSGHRFFNRIICCRDLGNIHTILHPMQCHSSMVPSDTCSNIWRDGEHYRGHHYLCASCIGSERPYRHKRCHHGEHLV